MTFLHLSLADSVTLLVSYGLAAILVLLCAMLIGPDLWREGKAWIFETFSDPPSDDERDALGTLTQIGGRERIVPFVPKRHAR